jgi:glycerol-3-phosphate acyltransferase PlsY
VIEAILDCSQVLGAEPCNPVSSSATSTILCCWALMPLAAYLLGSIPFGLCLCRAIKGVDIRESGSKNIGATNAGRVCGKPFFFAAFALDFLKGLAPVLVGGWVLAEFGPNLPKAPMMILFGALAVAGHTFPLYLRFKGGKAVATSFGVLVGLAPAAAAIAFGVWLVFFIALRYVSFASMLGAVAAPVAYAGLNWDRLGKTEYWPVLVFTVVVAALVVVRHRTNIKRLLAGTESRVSFKKKAD